MLPQCENDPGLKSYGLCSSVPECDRCQDRSRCGCCWAGCDGACSQERRVLHLCVDGWLAAALRSGCRGVAGPWVGPGIYPDTAFCIGVAEVAQNPHSGRLGACSASGQPLHAVAKTAAPPSPGHIIRHSASAIGSQALVTTFDARAEIHRKGGEMHRAWLYELSEHGMESSTSDRLFMDPAFTERARWEGASRCT